MYVDSSWSQHVSGAGKRKHNESHGKNCNDRYINIITRYINIHVYIFMKTVLKNYPSKQILSQKSKQVTNY